jgi:hypothetical protein
MIMGFEFKNGFTASFRLLLVEASVSQVDVLPPGGGEIFAALQIGWMGPLAQEPTSVTHWLQH